MLVHLHAGKNNPRVFLAQGGEDRRRLNTLQQKIIPARSVLGQSENGMFFGFLVPFHAQLKVRVGPVMGTAYKQSVLPPLRFNGVRSRMLKHLQHGYISLFHALLHVAHTTAFPAPASSPAPVSETRELVPVRGRRGAPHGLRVVVVGRTGPARK